MIAKHDLMLSKFLFILSITSISIPIAAELFDEKRFQSPLQAIVLEPIIEMNNSFPHPENPAASGETKPCHRAHQALFNEKVLILAERDDSAQIIISNIVYGIDPETQEPRNTFWVKKDKLLALSQLSDQLLNNIPQTKHGQEPTIVLIWPWQQFSIGTRFKRDATQDTFTHYAVIFNDYSNQKTITGFIPRTDALQELPKHTAQSSRILFVGLINHLMDRIMQTEQDNVIPYVWGGSSFLNPSKKNDFALVDGVWQRSCNTQPYTGYDCSEFIMRMAQISGINFPWKTSSIIGEQLQPLSPDECLKDGDIIWVKGHVMIISDIEKNEIIEARSYSSGYGYVHRTTLSEIFDDIATYADLLEQYCTQKTLRFKNREGQVQEKEYSFKLLKLN